MCIASMIGDAFRDNHWPNYPQPFVPHQGHGEIDKAVRLLLGEPVSRKEFNDLLEEVRLLRELLEKANAYDKLTGQPECETAEKVELLRRVGKALGIDLESVLNPN